jgi:hypothetical protein
MPAMLSVTVGVTRTAGEKTRVGKQCLFNEAINPPDRPALEQQSRCGCRRAAERRITPNRGFAATLKLWRPS